MNWWWLSFADGGEFLGATLVSAGSFVEAVAVTHRLGINPGGEVQGTEMPLMPVDAEWTNRLLSLADVRAIDGLKEGDL
jgi:hypothetical protein